MAKDRGLAIVNARFAEELTAHVLWCWHNGGAKGGAIGYAVASGPGTVGKRELLHRAVARLAGISLAGKIDHRNGNGLDCRVENLRAVNNSQNGMNRRKADNNSTGFIGVYKQTGRDRYVAQIKLNGVHRYLGVRGTPEEASDLYRAAVVELFGEYALDEELRKRQ